ncbi:hypothetical protein [Phormidium sp. CCY1219]|nr:hypothetical protein [Phormidium sp. CCY1219]MEB3828527.1 hypothetical protein [Phormidium sp. CCY1219]
MAKRGQPLLYHGRLAIAVLAARHWFSASGGKSARGIAIFAPQGLTLL